MKKEAGRAKKLAEKLDILTFGYANREKALKGTISQHWNAVKVRLPVTSLANASENSQSFNLLFGLEKTGGIA